MIEYIVIEKGGPGSGYHDHPGRLGEVGGSSKRSFDAEIDVMYEESAAKAKKVPAGHLESGLEVPGDWSAQEALFYQAVRDHVVKVHKSGRLDIDYRVLSGLLVRHRPGSAEKTMRGLTMAIAERMIEAGALVKLPEVVQVKDMERWQRGLSVSTLDDIVSSRVREAKVGNRLIRAVRREIYYNQGAIESSLKAVRDVYSSRDEEGCTYYLSSIVRTCVHELMHESTVATVGSLVMGGAMDIDVVAGGRSYIEGLVELSSAAMLGNVGDKVSMSSYTPEVMSALVLVGRRLSERGVALTARNIVRDAEQLQRLPAGQLVRNMQKLEGITVRPAGSPEVVAEYHKLRKEAEQYDDYESLMESRKRVKESDHESWEVSAIETEWEDIPLPNGKVAPLRVQRLRFGDDSECVVYGEEKSIVRRVMYGIGRQSPELWSRLNRRQRRGIQLLSEKMVEAVQNRDTGARRKISEWLLRLYHGEDEVK